MDDSERSAAIEAIRDLKAKYWRGIDCGDVALVRSILSADCVLDYRGCCTDPLTGIDHMPQMNLVMRGHDAWRTAPREGPRLVTVHQGHQHEIAVAEDGTATGLWAFTDRLFPSAGGPVTRLIGYGHYHDSYVREEGRWLLATSRITRLWVEAS